MCGKKSKAKLKVRCLISFFLSREWEGFSLLFSLLVMIIIHSIHRKDSIYTVSHSFNLSMFFSLFSSSIYYKMMSPNATHKFHTVLLLALSILTAFIDFIYFPKSPSDSIVRNWVLNCYTLLSGSFLCCPFQKEWNDRCTIISIMFMIYTDEMFSVIIYKYECLMWLDLSFFRQKNRFE